ncbi:MAG TPA: glucoamylase family protein [Elusimicrobiota bacterium]|nr:glucoamylase family protein [Elusimicrobiota bacterium]
MMMFSGPNALMSAGIEPGSIYPSMRELGDEDRKYLIQLARDTWECIDSLSHPATGLPYDNNNREAQNTSVSNIGVYAASLAGAMEMRFITREDALSRAGKLMDGLEKFKHWNGFCQSWNNIETFEPSRDDAWISVLDSGNLAGGLLVIKGAFPEMSARIGRYLDAMDWGKFYEPSTKVLYGGYNMATGVMNKEWKLTLLGSDSRLASFIAIGKGQAEPAHWDTLSRDMETRYGLDYLVPGWQGGGLFMQFISGIFVDDRATLMGTSAARFAYAQIHHAKVIGSPVWGWSASDTPNDGYLGWQAIKDRVVTPHASALPLAFFPKESVANLRTLEGLGVRAPMIVDGKSRHLGFRDSIDLSSNQVTRTYLVLDQSMLFLSLVNALTDGVIWKYAALDPLVQNARRLIPDYRDARTDDDSFWREIRSFKAEGAQVCINSIKAVREFSPGSTVIIPVHFEQDVPSAGTGLLWWRVMEDSTGRYVKEGKIKVSWPLKTPPPALSFSLTGDGLYVVQVALVDSHGRMISEDDMTIRVSAEDSTVRRGPLPSLPALTWDDVHQRWDEVTVGIAGPWDVNAHQDASGKINLIKEKTGDVLELQFNLRRGEWLEMVRVKPGSWDSLKRLAFHYRLSGVPMRMEVKMEDQDGSVFGYSKEIAPREDWSQAKIDVNRLRYLWGGNNALDLSKVAKLMIALAGPAGSTGSFQIKSIQTYRTKSK